MKKIFSILLILLTCISLSACNKKEENPVKNYSSLEELNKDAGVNIVKPATMGITNETFLMGDNQTAVYMFELNGNKFYVRACRDLENDMSGIFINNKPAFDGVTDKVAYAEGQGYRVCRMILGNKQYSFGLLMNEDTTDEYFENAAMEYKDQMIQEVSLPIVNELIGTYQDSTSQRANAVVTRADDINRINIDITWSSSAEEYEEWICECVVDMGMASYKQIKHIKNTVDEQGNTTLETNDEVYDGYFSITDNKLYWDGSGNNQTSSCVFEKID